MLGLGSVHKYDKNIVRSPSALVPLIKEDLRNAEVAADKAALPFWRNAGEKMLEAKGQFTHKEYADWLKRHFNISYDHSRRYTKLAVADETSLRARHESMSDALRAVDIAPRGSVRGGASLLEPLKDAINRADNIRNLHKEGLRREVEREAQRKLAFQLIEIGYKALSTKLHPDHGGSDEAMARLNSVRERLKKFA